ncbi:antirestriction protein [Xanthomonas campestris pv. euphorbiae]|nr:antirestriction protein [Xanthomonas campestris pv. euphorbiae]
MSEDGFYLAPNLSERLEIEVDGNGFRGELSADAAGIVATMFALGQLAAESAGTDAADALIDHYHSLGAFAAGHPEAAAIYRAID